MRYEFQKPRDYETGKMPLFSKIAITAGALAAILYLGTSFNGSKEKSKIDKPTNLETKVVQIEQKQAAPSENNIKYVIKEKNETENCDKELYGMLKRHEGIRNAAYPDTKGILTIGVGFNLEKEGAREKIESLGLDYNRVCSKKQKLSEEQIYTLMKDDVNTATSDAKSYIGESWNGLDPNAQKVVIDMSYNLGKCRLSKFKSLRKALINENYQEAAKQMENSRWYSQTKSRAKEDVGIMRNIRGN